MTGMDSGQLLRGRQTRASGALIPGLRIPRCGCRGRQTAMMKRHGASEVVGIELSPEAAERARTRLDHVVVAPPPTFDVSELAAEPFDALLLIDVVEHLVTRALFFGPSADLKPGGLYWPRSRTGSRLGDRQSAGGRWPRRTVGSSTGRISLLRAPDMVACSASRARGARGPSYFTATGPCDASLVLSLYVSATTCAPVPLAARKPPGRPPTATPSSPAGLLLGPDLARLPRRPRRRCPRP